MVVAPASPPKVLVVADRERAAELCGALADPLPTAIVSRVEVIASAGGDDAIDLFVAHRPTIVVIAPLLADGDAAALIRALRELGDLAVVVVGDPHDYDARELAPERIVEQPLTPRKLRFAVASALEAFWLARGWIAPPNRVTHPEIEDGDDLAHRSRPARSADLALADDDEARAAQRARWEALADLLAVPNQDERESSAPSFSGEPTGEPEPLPPPVTIRPRRAAQSDPAAATAWQPGTTDGMEQWVAPPPSDEPPQPTREPTLIISDHAPRPGYAPSIEDEPPRGRSITEPVVPPRTVTSEPPASRTRTGDAEVDLAERAQPGGAWSEPMPLAELLDQEPATQPEPMVNHALPEPPRRDSVDDLARMALDGFDDDVSSTSGARPRLEVVDELPEAPPAASSGDGRDFARQLRAKMSMMAQRLFHGADVPAPGPVDLAPRHDHHTEIDLAALADEPALGGNGTEIDVRPHTRGEPRDVTTAPGSWDSQVRERGLPDGGEVARGVSDAAQLLAKMFANQTTGRLVMRHGGIEKVVYFDQGRPVFASSSATRDRMGELLVREGKITAAQYERCQTVVSESGRRMGEILVDFGYLKRRELLPAVRRHVEDIIYSLFGWERGSYQIIIDSHASGERIRLSRHPAALILEGIRRKLDRTTLERLIGSPSTVIEITDRERLGAVIHTSDLAAEERSALAAFDGHADLAHVAAVVAIDVADILPLAWGLCVLGLAHARRADTEAAEEATALVGETDLAIDRERVRARWLLVSEADYFALLGVRRDATGFEIRRAYQAARRDFALESFPTDLRRELAQELDDIACVLDEAFRVLRDDGLRSTYLANLVD